MPTRATPHSVRYYRCSVSELQKLKSLLTAVPVFGVVARLARKRQKTRDFVGSDSYWEARYAEGGSSGTGSYGRLARAKAEILNSYVRSEGIMSVLEIGCGDGNQLTLADYPNYIGFDVSHTVIAACRERFAGDPTKLFEVSGDEQMPICELGLSLDVIYHLVEDEVFEQYMADLLGHSSKLVVLYTSDSDVFVPKSVTPPHIRHRPIGRWMTGQKDWRLRERIANPYPYRVGAEGETSYADFYVYERIR
jgi:SAM-dependent methyltransferase